MKATHLIVLAVRVCACRVSTQARVVIDTVAVGNASNAADPTTGEAMSNEPHPQRGGELLNTNGGLSNSRGTSTPLGF